MWCDVFSARHVERDATGWTKWCNVLVSQDVTCHRPPLWCLCDDIISLHHVAVFSTYVVPIIVSLQSWWTTFFLIIWLLQLYYSELFFEGVIGHNTSEDLSQFWWDGGMLLAGLCVDSRNSKVWLYCSYSSSCRWEVFTDVHVTELHWNIVYVYVWMWLWQRRAKLGPKR